MTLDRRGQVFSVGRSLLLVVRSLRGGWHDLMTLDDWSSDPHAPGNVEQYHEEWILECRWERVC